MWPVKKVRKNRQNEVLNILNGVAFIVAGTKLSDMDRTWSLEVLEALAKKGKIAKFFDHKAQVWIFQAI